MKHKCLDSVLASAEAEAEWGLAAGTVRAACGRGVIRPEECRKAGRDWLVTRAGMKRQYGEPVRFEVVADGACPECGMRHEPGGNTLCSR